MKKSALFCAACLLALPAAPAGEGRPADTPERTANARLAAVAGEPGPEMAAESRAEPLTADGAWCWFADPRAVRRGDITFVSYITSVGDIMISAYDHKTGKLITVRLHERLKQMGTTKDDHGNPAILIRSDGRLMVFYSGHSMPPMYCRVSRNPLDVSAWEDETTVPIGRGGVTYPNPVQLSAEQDRIYLFFRGGSGGSGFVTSDDGGKTWAKPRGLVAASRPYFKMVSDGRSRIHIVYNDSHPHDFVNNVYYLRYENGAFGRADGTRIKGLDELPLKPSEGEAIYLAKDHKNARAWVWDIALDAEGRPTLAYATIPDKAHHAYRCARWDGKAWQDREVLGDAGGHIDGPREWCYSGGIILNHSDPRIVYLSRQVGAGFQVERWETGDGGASWKSQVLAPAAGAENKNVRPFSPWGCRPGEMEVIWMRGTYNYWTDYRTALVAWPMARPVEPAQ